jgi:hypothetical protein
VDQDAGNAVECRSITSNSTATTTGCARPRRPRGRIDHELRLLLVDVMAAVRVADVFRVRHELGELLLRPFFCAASVT